MNSSAAASRITPAARGTGLWFVASGANLKGPFSFEELVIELDASRVAPGDFCWRQGFQEWRPLCSVDEFGISRDRPQLLSPYPSVPLPSNGRVGRRSSDRKNSTLAFANTSRPRIIEEHRVVKLRVQKNAKSTVTWLERMGFFFFSILAAYLSVWVVTSEFEIGFDQKLFVRNLGRLETLGAPSPQNVPIPYFTAGPLFTAVGFAEYNMNVDVALTGTLESAGVQSYEVDGQRLLGARPFEEWSPKKMGIDAIYQRQFAVYGQIGSTYPGVVRYLNDGEPTQFVSTFEPGDFYRP